ncbi:MAG: polysaccharide pyruvyl transferase CsaB [Candidatus Melainabacteria bacterium]|nr:polysaccharide pyruvyl transferase CsaB [Candidatus Melainabacteria bacterium]
MSHSTKSVVISGYYGFDNLGDEAILEQLCNELRQIDPGMKICVLSQNPQSTSTKYDVESISRWSVTRIYQSLDNADLFISGGGGLFQDSSSIKSVVYYAFLFFLARIRRVPIFVYAQGIGPLKSNFSRFLTRASMTLATCISVRDKKSVAMLDSWDISANLTCDPVFGLKKCEDSSDTNNGAKKALRIGLSMRQCEALSASWLETIKNSLQNSLPENSIVVPLILQENLDKPVLDSVLQKLDKVSIELLNLKTNDLPSKWMGSIASLDLVIAMRLHALIMALKSGVPALALAYDPKVNAVAKDFDQPYVDMLDSNAQNQFEQKLLELLDNRKNLALKAGKIANDKENEARQNKDLLAKFLK